VSATAAYSALAIAWGLSFILIHALLYRLVVDSGTRKFLRNLIEALVDSRPPTLHRRHFSFAPLVSLAITNYVSIYGVLLFLFYHFNTKKEIDPVNESHCATAKRSQRSIVRPAPEGAGANAITKAVEGDRSSPQS
jgi:hypothetical protein